MNLENKRIVITGATSGIGLHLLKVISEKAGVQLVACGRKTENLPHANNIYPFRADVSTQEGMDALFHFSMEKMGGIDIFFANAGFAYYEKFGSASWKHIEDIFSTNVVSPLYALSKMIELNNSNEFMVIITCSVIGKLPFPGFSLYTGSKFALDGFNSAMQYEMPENGHLMLVYPVATYTEFFRRAGENSNMPRPHQKTEEVVKAVLKGITRNKKRVFPFPLIKPVLYLINLFPFLVKPYYSVQKKKVERQTSAK